MKTYPSIPDDYASYYGKEYVAFYKYDGSNLRFLWTQKNGWCRYGTRTRLFDHTDPLYSQAIPIFNEKYKERLTWIIRNTPEYKGVKEVLAFAEFFGPSSFAGEHSLSEPKDLKLFDINIGGRGFVDPWTFKQKFGCVDIAKTISEGVLDEKFAKDIRNGDRPDIIEGVICKGGTGHKLWMVKIKSRKYIERLHEYERIKAERVEGDNS